MKLLMTLILSSLALSSFARDLETKTFYQPKFKYIAMEPLCPNTSDTINCMAIGTNIIVKANLNGCLDKNVFFNSQVKNVDGDITISIAAVAEYDPRNILVRCSKIPDITKTISIPTADIKSININNQIIDNKSL